MYKLEYIYKIIYTYISHMIYTIEFLKHRITYIYVIMTTMTTMTTMTNLKGKTTVGIIIQVWF